MAKLQERISRVKAALFRSHGVVTGFGVLSLMIMFSIAFQLHRNAMRIAEQRSPCLKHSMTIERGTHKSLASLRAWILVGDDKFKQARLECWSDEIEPSFASLEDLLSSSTTQSELDELSRLKDRLRQLKAIQWWVEDVSHTPGNEPARAMYVDEIQPVAVETAEAITDCIEIEKLAPGNDRHLLLAAMADTRGFFLRSQTVLSTFIDEALVDDEQAFTQYLGVARAQAQYLHDHSSDLSAEQQTLIELVLDNLAVYEVAADKVLSLRLSEKWNVAVYRLENEAIPIAEEVSLALKSLTDRHGQLMQDDSNSIARTGNAALLTSLGLIIVLSAVSILIVDSRTRSLRERIGKLAQASRDFRLDRSSNPLSEEGNDELTELTQTFNEMQIRIADQLSELDTTRSQIQMQEQRLQAVLHSAPIAIVMINESGLIVLANREAERIFGYETGELSGKPLESLIPQRYGINHVKQRQQYLRSPLSRRMDSGAELFGITKDGTEFPVEVGLSPVHTQNSTFVLSAITDISSRKHHEQLLHQSREQALKALKAKEEFLANMSHEIRTPMNAIIGLTDIVLRSRLNDVQRDYLQTVADSSESLLQVINDLLDVSKIEAGKLSLDKISFQVRDTVYDVLKSLSIRAIEKEIELHCLVENDVPDVLNGDPNRLKQILLNLVGNAIKFTHSGHVIVRVKVAPRDRELDVNIKLNFTVEDTGIGIPEDKTDEIFKPFEQVDNSATRRFGGTGLGLSISSRLVEAMGGSLSVNSVLGLGSTFQFSAVFERSTATPRQPWRTVVSSLAGLKVLVVDNRDINLTILEEILGSKHMFCERAHNATDAIRALTKSFEQKRPFDVVITDMNMPQASGLELAQRLKADATLSSVPIILLTSLNTIDEIPSYRDLGISAVLPKPFKDSLLFEALVNALDLALPTKLRDQPVSGLTKKPAERALRVLLAEDSKANQKLARAILEQQGHQVTIVETGKEAIAAVNARHFDVVLMDIQMPIMDGLTATKRIREIEEKTGAHLPIVAMTAHALAGDREKFIEAGMDSYVSKPVRVMDLENVISVALTKRVIAPTQPTSGRALKDFTIPWNTLLGQLNNNPATLLEIASEYREEMREAYKRLKSLNDGDDHPQIYRLSHKLKTAFNFFRIDQLADLAEELESSTVKPFGASVPKLIKAIVPSLESVIQLIDDYVNEHKEVPLGGQDG